MATPLDWVFRFLHILSGVMWVGGAALWSMVIAPRVLRDGPPAIRRPFLEAVLAAVTRYFTIAGIVTILSGFVVLALLRDGDVFGGFQGGSYGIALSIGLLASIVMLIEGLFVIKPTARSLLAEMQKLPPGPPTGPPPEAIPRLGKKLGIAGMASMLVGTIALGAMAWAVNVVR